MFLAARSVLAAPLRAAAARSFSVCAAARHDISNNTSSIRYSAPKVTVGAPAPLFAAPAVAATAMTTFDLAKARGSWVVLLFYPKDFTFVCPTELIAFNDAQEDFAALNARVVAISTDTENSHLAWNKMPRAQGGLGTLTMPLVADTTKQIAADYGVLLPNAGIALRGLFIINPKGVVEQMTVNNLPVGRSVDETLRLLQAFQFTSEHGEVCPANWTPGDKTMVPNPNDSQSYFSSVWGGNKAFGKVTNASSAADVARAVASPKSVVFYSADNCGKCTQIAPYVGHLSEANSDVSFVHVNTSGPLADTAKDAGVNVVPTFKLFRNGQPAGEVIGYKKKVLADAVALL